MEKAPGTRTTILEAHKDEKTSATYEISSAYQMNSALANGKELEKNESVHQKARSGGRRFEDSIRPQRDRGGINKKKTGWRSSQKTWKETFPKSTGKEGRDRCDDRRSDEKDQCKQSGQEKFDHDVCQDVSREEQSKYGVMPKKNSKHPQSTYLTEEPLNRTSRSSRYKPGALNDAIAKGSSQLSSFRAALSFEGCFKSADDLKENVSQCLDEFENLQHNFVEDSVICGEKRSACTIIIHTESKQAADQFLGNICSRLSRILKIEIDFIISKAAEEKHDVARTNHRPSTSFTFAKDKGNGADSSRPRSKQFRPNSSRQGATPIQPGSEAAEHKTDNSRQTSHSHQKTPDQIPTKLLVTTWKSFSGPKEVTEFLNETVGQLAAFSKVLSETVEVKGTKTVCQIIASSKTSALRVKKKLNSSSLPNLRISCHEVLSTDLENKAKLMKTQIQRTHAKIEKKMSFALKSHDQRMEMNALKNDVNADLDKNCMDIRDELIGQRDEFVKRVSYLKDSLKSLDPVATTVKDLTIILNEVTTECKRLEAHLPIYARRKDIVTHVLSNQVTIILGETGSGKSTQMAQYLYEAGLAGEGQIACTQPRKVAAITLAERVAEEMGGQIGSVVGYKAGVQKQMSKNTKIIFLTDHSLLNVISKDPKLTNYSCIIVDEAHERSIYTDLLLGMIKACLPDRPDLKVIITSATIDPEIFIKYFNSGPELQVSGRAFPVDVFYDNTDGSQDFENFESKAVAKAVEIHKNEDPGDILVFLTSSIEIMRCCEEFRKRLSGQNNFRCFPLHGQLPPDEQKKVFERLPMGTRKIVFATNCAETSITINGIKYVIDTGVAKEMKYDLKKNISLLDTHVISKSSADQRKGRAGRTSPGKCYRLYSEDGYDSMDPISKPEILKVHLGQAVLKLAELGVDVKTYDFVQPPSEDAIDSALSTLQQLGALSGSKITDIGRWISKLPFDPRQGFLVFQGNKENLLYDTVVLASLISNGLNLFYRGFSESEEQASARSKNLFGSPYGDIFTWLEVYKTWSQLSKNKQEKWCRENSINIKVASFTQRCVQEVVATLGTEMDIKLELKFASNGNSHVPLRKIVFDTYRSSLCHYFGHLKAGYYAVELDRQVHIHPSSSLTAQNSQSEWVVYTEFIKTSRDFIRGIVVVEEQWILDAVKDGTLAIDIAKIKQKRAALIHTEGVGSVVFRKIVGPRYSNLRILEDKLSQTCTEAVVVEADKALGILDIYSSSPMTQQVLERFNEAKKNIIEPLQSEVFEIGIATNQSNEKCGFRIAVGHGGSVEDVFMPGETSKILIKKIPYDTAEEDIREKFEAFGDIKECFQFKSLDPWGFIRYESYLQALAAVEATSKDKENIAVLCAQNHTRKEKASYEAKLSWCRRPIKGNGTAFITCSPQDRQRLIHQHIKLRGKDIKIEVPNRPDSMDVVCENTGLADEKEIEQKILDFLEKDESTEHDIGVKVVRHEAKILFDADVTRITEYISENFEMYTSRDKFEIKILTHHSKAKVDQVAFIRFVDPMEGFHACRELQEEMVVSGQVVEISTSLKTSITVPKAIMDVCEASFSKVITELKERENVELTIRALRRDFAIDIRSTNVEHIIEIRKLLQKELEGKVFDCKGNDNSKRLFNQQGKEFLDKVEKQCAVHIVCDHRLHSIHVHGLEVQTDEALKQIQSYLTKLGDGKHVDFSLRGPEKPAGLMKALIIKYGPQLEGLIQTFALNDVLIDFKRQKLSLIGTDKAVEETSTSLLELQNILASQEVVEREKGIPDCVVCLSAIDNDSQLYRLEGCGHSYCMECLKLQITVSMNEKKFPIVCANEDCSVPLVRIDLQMALKEKWITEDKLLEMSLNAFVTEHPHEYKFCPTPNCLVVYEITTDEKGNEFTCPSCSFSICTTCSTLFHPGLTCSMVTYLQEPDKGLEAWIDENDAKRKRCPGCKCTVEKIEGCNKMHCTSCKTYFCWVCLAVCKNEQESYKHLMKIHGKMY